MKTINKTGGHHLWLTMILMTTLLVGCHADNENQPLPPPVVTNPTVVSVIPLSAATAVLNTTTVSATFSEAMDASTINEQSFIVTNADSVVSGTIALDAASNIATFTPATDLNSDTEYVVTLTSSVSSAAGGALLSDFVWHFTTAMPADTTAPTITSHLPADLASNVALNVNISANFSEGLDLSTINSASFMVNNGVTSVIGAVSYNNLTATFSPTDDLLANTLYTVTLMTDITDLADPANALANELVWTFTTAAIADTTAPTVNSTTPANGAVTVAINANISANFSEALDPATVNSNSYTLSDGSTAVAGVVSY